MTHHLPDFVIVLIFAGIYLFVFVLGEVIRRLVPSKPEIPRKAVHFASGLIALSIPCFLKSHWWLLSLVASFTVILALAQKKHLFESIFGGTIHTRASTGGSWLLSGTGMPGSSWAGDPLRFCLLTSQPPSIARLIL